MKISRDIAKDIAFDIYDKGNKRRKKDDGTYYSGLPSTSNSLYKGNPRNKKAFESGSASPYSGNIGMEGNHNNGAEKYYSYKATNTDKTSASENGVNKDGLSSDKVIEYAKKRAENLGIGKNGQEAWASEKNTYPGAMSTYKVYWDAGFNGTEYEDVKNPVPEYKSEGLKRRAYEAGIADSKEEKIKKDIEKAEEIVYNNNTDLLSKMKSGGHITDVYDLMAKINSLQAKSHSKDADVKDTQQQKPAEYGLNNGNKSAANKDLTKKDISDKTFEEPNTVSDKTVSKDTLTNQEETGLQLPNSKNTGRVSKAGLRLSLKAGSVLALRSSGLNISADFFENSLKDNPQDLKFDIGSKVSDTVKNSKEMKEFLKNIVHNASGDKLSYQSNNIDKPLIVFNETKDLKLSIQRAHVKLEAEKLADGRWKVKGVLSDIYDFTKTTSLFDPEEKDKTKSFDIPTVANDIAALLQNIGVIVPYNVSVNFECIPDD